MRSKFLFRILLVLWLLGIFYISLSPNPSKIIPFHNAVGESALHFFSFFVLFFLFYFSILSENRNFILRIAVSAILTILVSIAKEIGQIFIPVRAFTLSDLFIDCMGGGVCALILMGVNYKLKFILTRIDYF